MHVVFAVSSHDAMFGRALSVALTVDEESYVYADSPESGVPRHPAWVLFFGFSL